LFSLARRLEKVRIRVILIQIHEAHSDAWPVNLPNQPKPHKDFADRVKRAREFTESDIPPYDIYIDGWDDVFEQRFRAWPDKYYYLDKDLRVIEKSEYGEKADALINYDCIDLLRDILKTEDNQTQ